MNEAFVPTHRIPSTGLPAWNTPDGSRPAAAHAEPGLDVQLLAVHGGWAQVRFSNEWVAWLDGGRLEPIASARGTDARPRRREWLLVVGALVVIGLATAAVLFLLSGDDEEPSVVAAPVALAVPEGWSVSEDGMVAAEQEADLTAAVPAGPKVTALIATGDDDVFPEIEAALATEVSLAAEPEVTEVSGVDAFAVTLGEGGLVRRYVVARRPEQPAVLFTLEAPVDQWPEVEALLASVPGLPE